MKAKIVRYRGGNHTDENFLVNGDTIFEGTVTEVKRELTEMRKMYRRKWYEASTEDKREDYVDYCMQDIRAYKCVDEIWKRYW